ncbi:MAG: hypothetical protein NTZ59_13350 [Bacteroidetes bacterium]|jgi:hypothetical protein|nr:hypothetical protein [Bacteroidota bacterium]
MKSKVAKILSVAAILLFVLGCKKNDGKGKLYLNLKSVNGNSFVSGDNVVFSFEFNHPTTGETKDTLIIRTKFFTCSNSNVTAKQVLPTFTSTADYPGNFDLAFKIGGGGSYTNPCNIVNTNNYRKDSLIYTFWLKDKDGNLSDSVSSDKIILKP